MSEGFFDHLEQNAISLCSIALGVYVNLVLRIHILTKFDVTKLKIAVVLDFIVWFIFYYYITTVQMTAFQIHFSETRIVDGIVF